ncbi:MAG: zinc-binding dehydrogenase [Elusimicrobiota bacterium]|nr:zinc-binding dehydrogenase [Elusimicrobiota bacterium]
MRAVVLTAFGGPENLELRQVPEPAPGPGEVLLRVRACALNHLDLWVRAGLPAAKVKLPFILGSDAAGEVASLGPGVAGHKVGDRVAVHPGRSCGACPACAEGREPDCPAYGIIGAYGGHTGAYCEFLAVPERHLLPMPHEDMSFTEAASLPLAALTAWNMLTTEGGLRTGQTVLIVGAGAGVSVMAIQIARALGARVIATTSDPSKVERARELGAHEVILHPPEDLARAVRRLTGGAMADLVFEHVGKAVIGEALKCLRPSGRLVTCGATSGYDASIDLRWVFSKRLKILGAKMGNLADMREVWKLAVDGRLRPVIDKVFALADARLAHERLESRGQFGKVVLET